MNDDPKDLVAKLASLEASSKELDDKREAGPNDVGPTTSVVPNSPLVTLPFTAESIGQWWIEIERARSRVKSREDSWDALIDEYLPIVSRSGVAETVKVQAHFRNVHTKLGNLFYRLPDVILEPDDPGPADNMLPAPPMPMAGVPNAPPSRMEQVIAIKQAVLKKTMGRDGIKAGRLMDELLFDVLAWSGIGCCKVGYEATFKTMKQPKMVPAPMESMPGSIFGLNTPPMVEAKDGMGQTVMEDVSVPVHESYYARRFSSKKALWNSDLRSTRFDEDATWIGMDFYLSPKRAIAELKITPEEADKLTQDDRIHKYKDDENGSRGTGLVHGIEIFCKARFFTDEVHPEAMCQLTLIEGIRDRPVVWRMSPYQDFDPKTGRITPDSLTGFPIKILTIRDLADSCFPPSDSAFTNSEIKQLSTYRRQTIQIRDAAIGKYLYDPDAFDDTDVDTLKNGAIGSHIPVQASKLKDGVDKVYAQTSKITGSADDQRGFQGIKQDVGETLGIGSNQSGVETDTVRTAAESDNVAHAVQARNEKEMGRVIDIYLDIVRAIDQLQMRYMTQDAYVQIGGEAAGAMMVKWTGKMVSGKFLYDIAPDSQLRPDSARTFQQDLQFYNLTAKDPMVNRAYMLKRLARARGYDPAKFVVPPPPPQEKKEPLKLSLSIVADDLARPEVQALIAAFGGNVAATVNIKGEQPEHGGPAERGDVISEHLMSNSGGKQNAPHAENHREGQVK